MRGKPRRIMSRGFSREELSGTRLRILYLAFCDHIQSKTILSGVGTQCSVPEEATMFKSLFRCIRKLFSRIKLKQRDKLQRVTDHGANIDIEEALAEELEIQRRSGRVLSSTASIAAALRQRPRRSMPVFSTHLGNDEHSKSSNPTIKAAVEEMQKLTSGYIGRRSESRMSAASPVTSVVSPAVSKGPLSSRMSSSNGSSCNIPESVPEDAEPEKETETKENASSATERASEGNFRRSSIFDMRSEWI